MDRSRLATNKENYNGNKTIKKDVLRWVRSKNYEKLHAQLADVQRRAAAHRKCVANEVGNWVLGQAGCVRVEKNNSNDILGKPRSEPY